MRVRKTCKMMEDEDVDVVISWRTDRAGHDMLATASADGTLVRLVTNRFVEL